MKALTGGLGLLLGLGLIAVAGCSEDNESFIREQQSRVKSALPRARGVQAETQEEYYASNPGLLGGAGLQVGPVPDQGTGYPGYPSRKR